MPKIVSAAEAVKAIQSRNRVYIHSVAAAPQVLIDARVARAPELRNVEIVHLHTESSAPYVEKAYRESFTLHSLFVGPNVREAPQRGFADYIPVFLLARLFHMETNTDRGLGSKMKLLHAC